jgi:hypothetical protein
MLLLFFLLAIASAALIGFCARWSYQAGFRDGREQGLMDSYRLYGGRRAGSADPIDKERDKIGA